MSKPKDARAGHVTKGLHHDLVSLAVTDERYMERWFVYLGRFTLRVHKFFRGDDDRAPHDHPFAFVTFPLVSYIEDVYLDGGDEYGPKWIVERRVVKAWRPHFRPATYRHIVIGRADGKTTPFVTLVLTRYAQRRWGFWPSPGKFVPWREYLNTGTETTV